MGNLVRKMVANLHVNSVFVGDCDLICDMTPPYNYSIYM